MHREVAAQCDPDDFERVHTLNARDGGNVGSTTCKRGFLNMISWDLVLFNDSLFSLANSCMCSSSRSLVWTLDAGMTKLESSAKFEHIVSSGYRTKIGRRYDVRKRSQTGTLDDARHNRSEGRLDIVEFCTVVVYYLISKE